MNHLLDGIIDLEKYPLQDQAFRHDSKATLDEKGVLVLSDFIKPEAIASIQKLGEAAKSQAYFTANAHNIYIADSDPQFPETHPRNREVASSKGCITTNQIPSESVLHPLYESSDFREFLCTVLGEAGLYEYADPLSSINLHFASEGQELGWHFDNSSFAITLMVQEPEAGGVFEFVKDVRDADKGEMNYELSGDVLDGKVKTKSLSMPAGTLVLFRGRNSIHRVTPVEGSRTRMLVVLAYNTEPNIALSESARMTFYGRLS